MSPPNFRPIVVFLALSLNWLVDESSAQLVDPVVVEAKLVKGESQDKGGDRFENWFYEFTLKNSGREDFKNLEVHYRIFHHSEVGPDGRPETDLEYDQRAVLVPELKSRSTAIAKSKEMTLALGESRAQARDIIKAVWVRVADQGSVEIGVLHPPSSIAKKFKWEEPLTVGGSDRQPADSAPTSTSPGSSPRAGTPNSETPAMKKMKLITIPVVDFKDTPLADAIQYLNQQSIVNDETESEPAKRGVRIKLGKDFDPSLLESKVTLRIGKVTLSEALRYTTALMQMKFQGSGDDIEVVPLSSR